MKQAAFALAILLLSSLATFGLTQVDPRAKALLDGTEHNVAPQPETLETVDMTLCTTSLKGKKRSQKGAFA